MDLVLEVRGRCSDLARERDDAARFGEVAGERLLADQSLELRAVAHRVRDLFHHVDAEKVGVEDRDDVDVWCHLADALEHPRLAEPACTDRLGQLVRGRA